MQYIRLIHPNDYDRNRKRLVSLAFRPSSDGGISVIECECVAGTGASVCEHIRRFYASRVHPDFILFWTFDAEALPSSSRIESTPGGKDDSDGCHRDIFDLDERESGKIIKKVPIHSLDVCRSGTHSKCTDDDIERIITAGLTRPFVANGEIA
jgi:hypothetical protein